MLPESDLLGEVFSNLYNLEHKFNDILIIQDYFKFELKIAFLFSLKFQITSGITLFL